MSRTWQMMLIVPFVLLALASLSSAKGESPIEPGPENGGLRLRLRIEWLPRSGDAYDVRLDLINTTANEVKLQTGWESVEAGGVKEYLSAAANIETTPRLPQPRGASGVVAELRKPQKEQMLGPHETLTMQWQTARRILKNESLLGAANPEFTQPGLYSVHVNLDVITASGTIHLRSNEQLVPMGGSRKQPKATSGDILKVSRDRTTAEIELGTNDQVAVGDQFDITSKVYHWRLTVTEVAKTYSKGSLELLSTIGDSTPTRGDEAIFIELATARK